MSIHITRLVDWPFRIAVIASLAVTGCAHVGPPAGQVDAVAAAVAPPPSTQPEVGEAVLAAFAPRQVSEAGEVVLRYRLLSPTTQPAGEKFPLVIFLHGSGERGEDNYRQLIHGGKEFLHHSKRHPAFYVFPQCPKGTWWSTSNKLRTEANPAAAAPPMEKIVDLIDRMVRTEAIDPGRIYVAGLSMGGFGTYELVGLQPKRFAAAIPMCGGGNLEIVPKYRSTPFWLFHGDADTAVNVRYSRDMAAAMKRAGVSHIYTEYPGGNHNAWTPTLTNDAVIDWMFAQRRK